MGKLIFIFRRLKEWDVHVKRLFRNFCIHLCVLSQLVLKSVLDNSHANINGIECGLGPAVGAVL